jgi:hypothetical protein
LYISTLVHVYLSGPHLDVVDVQLVILAA